MKERRGSPRADIAVALRTVAPGEPEEQIRTVNLSASGVCYVAHHWVEPLTRMEMSFAFPVTQGEGDAGERRVSVEAIVVRTEPPEPAAGLSEYRVACFFSSISREDRAFIEDFVRRSLVSSGTNA